MSTQQLVLFLTHSEGNNKSLIIHLVIMVAWHLTFSSVQSILFFLNYLLLLPLALCMPTKQNCFFSSKSTTVPLATCLPLKAPSTSSVAHPFCSSFRAQLQCPLLQEAPPESLSSPPPSGLPLTLWCWECLCQTLRLWASQGLPNMAQAYWGPGQ